ncbi:hypothetical protein EYZ11_012486 [Aspergillus tanneri]|uniref:Uncharacterized protein n=1 Tax=Aspergillus tanneri TaxID=1220188 RepID=A0A4S3J0Q1_9EURO|nr:hypothetical protein EYZ11_012486 [Aspergillus tanneri]
MRPDRVYLCVVELGIFDNAWLVAGSQFIEDSFVGLVWVAILQSLNSLRRICWFLKFKKFVEAG